jgi:hypothetical protein
MSSVRPGSLLGRLLERVAGARPVHQDSNGKNLRDGDTDASPGTLCTEPAPQRDAQQLAPPVTEEPAESTVSPTTSEAFVAKTYPPDAYSNFEVYQQLLPHVLSTFPEKAEQVRNALRAYTSVSVEDEASGLYTDPIRVLNFFQIIEAANKLPPGDYIELGSHRGYSLRVISTFMDKSQTLYSLDTFEGFDERDISVESQKYDSPWTAGNFGPTSVERVARYVGDGVWPPHLKVVKGWFPDSFKGLEGKQWRFVHIDFDLYQPIKSAMETLWEPLLPGGVMMVHDYGSYGFPAARKAVDEFAAAVGVYPIELPDRWSTAVLRKPAPGLSRGKPAL